MYQWRGLGDSSSIQSLISSLAPSYGIPPNLALAVANQESGFNPSAVSPAGAVGVMQLMPGTAKQLGVTDSTDPSQNVPAGLSYLQQMYAKFGNWTQALEAYNAGPSGNLAGSSGYASSILAAAGPLGGVPVLPSDSEDSGTVDAGVDLTDQSGGLSGLTLALAALGAAVLVWAAA